MINQTNKNLPSFPQIPITETDVVLDQNQITLIPATVGNLNRLQRLHLRNNKISELPIQIGNLKNLKLLLLSNNNISKLPAEIGDLISLTQLRLDNNKLTELPKEIGKLINLTHLFLDNNNISNLPEEIKNLKKLVHLSLTGNQIPLPNSYAPNKPNETISFILEKQNDLIDEDSDSLLTEKALFFINASKPSVEKKYQSVLNTFSNDKSIEFIPINEVSDITEDTNVIFIIAPLDIHENNNLIFDIIKKSKQLEIKFYILSQEKFIEKEFEYVNLEKINDANTLHSFLSKEHPNEFNAFNSYEEFDNLIFEALKQHKPNIRFTNLYLENIGHFSKLDIPFDNALTCLIGENGTGKSTILRSLAIATIGHNHKKIEERVKKNFLKIQNFSEDILTYEPGIIRLEYTIDGIKHQNELVFTPMDNGNEVSISQSGNFEIIYGKYYLKSLIVGFPQARGNDAINNSDLLSNKITQPHVNDLIPLIINSDDYRLRSFAGWVANLYFDSIKSRDKNSLDLLTKEDIIISEAFEIISKITKKEIKFKSVKAVDPPEVWVTTFDSPNGVPLYLISQGFKIVIGWIGYLLQRFVNTFPLSEPKSAFKENAILILDEIDTSIHPVWQSSFLDILRETFVNTQFIFTTHSPLMIAGLNREQVVELSIQDNEVVALKNQIDTWALTYRDILQKLFDTWDPPPTKTIEELKEQISQTQDKELINNLLEDIKRLEESVAFENNLIQYEQQLKEKQEELNELILKYKEKIK